MHLDWVRSVRDQCQEAGVPFFFKQWGEWAPMDAIGATAWTALPNKTPAERKGRGVLHGGPYDGTVCVALDFMPLVRIGKKRAGRLLDGREWNEFPKE